MKFLLTALLLALAFGGVAVAQDSLSVRRLGQIAMGDFVNCVAVVDTLAYVGEGMADGAFRVVDVSDPTNPQLIGSLTTSQAVTGVAIAGNYAYLAEYTAGLKIIDISNPAVPTQVGSYDTPGGAQGVTLAGNYAYVADCFAGLRVINISNPASPTEVGFYDTPLCAWDVAVSGNYAYVANYNDGFRIIDISNPAAPFQVGVLPTTSYAQGVAVAGNYAYVGYYNGEFKVVDIQNPATPTQVGSLGSSGDVMGVAVSGDYAFVADAFGSGLRVINISNPVAPAEVGYYDTPGVALGLAVAGNNVAYVADRDYLGIYDCSPAARLGIDERPLELSFGNVPVGHDSVRTLTIQNTGNVPLTVNAITAPAGYSHTFDLPFVIAVGDSVTDSVRFSPAAEQLYNDNLVISSSAPSDTIYVSLTGEGIGSQPGISYSPTLLSFGNIQVGQDSTRLLTIRNTGEGVLTVFSLTAPTGYAALFTTPFTLAGGDSITDTVRFRPTQVRHYGGHVIITCNAPGNPFFVSLSGDGGLPAISVSPAVLAYGTVEVGQDSVLALMVNNTGTFPLTVSDMTVPAGFTASLALPIVIAPGDSVADSVRFTPTAEQDYGGDLVITSDAPTGPTTVTVTGIGVLPSRSDPAAAEIPTNFYLAQNFPNPFNPTTTIRFGLPRSSLVQLQIFDLQGRLVETLASRVFEAGTHAVKYDASGSASGIYVVQMTSGNFSAAHRIALLK